MASGTASYDGPGPLERRRAIARAHREPIEPPPRPLEERLRALCPRGDETVVDVGCGHGDFARLLLPLLPRGRWIGVDPSPGMLAGCREAVAGVGGRAHLIRGRAQALPIADASVDVVLTAFLLFFFDERELAAALHEARRVLRPGGRLLANAYGAGDASADIPGLALSRVAPGAQFESAPPPWRMETSEAILRAAGFGSVRAEEIRSRLVFGPDEGDDLAELQLTYHGELRDRLPAGVDADRFLAALAEVAREQRGYTEASAMAWYVAEGQRQHGISTGNTNKEWQR